MIVNPNPALPEKTEDEDRPFRPKAHVVKYDFDLKDYDSEVDQMLKGLDTRIINVDAKLREVDRQGNFIYRRYSNLRELYKSPSFVKRVREQYSLQTIREAGEQAIEGVKKRHKKLREAITSDDFYYGLYPDERNPSNKVVFPIQDTYLPTSNSPTAKQQLWVDYQSMHAKAFEAATKNPIAKRIVKIIPQFVVGRNVVGKTPDPNFQSEWNKFWKLNAMALRVKRQVGDLVIFGEIFNRFFRTQRGLVTRSLDPSTIWDIVTNPEDLEDVLYYHQQYMVTMNSPVASITQLLPATLIIRQIPADEVDHFKINSTSFEKRGRSELYAILGWLLRFKEFMNDRVLLNKMKAMFALDVAVEGDPNEVDAVRAQFAEPPGTGSAVVHNKTVEVEFKNPNANAQDAQADADMLLQIIAVGAGVSKHFLGVSKDQSRAGALISTEPDVKNFEDYREIVESMLEKAGDRIKELKKIPDDVLMEFVFPSIAQEDRTAKLKDIALAEAMDYFSKRRAAGMVAHEFDITNYDYDEEQATILIERQLDPVIATGFQQQQKIAPDPFAALGGMEGGEAGMEPANGDTVTGDGKQPLAADLKNEPNPIQPGAEAGFSAKGKSGRSLPNTQATLSRGTFTRDGEKAALTGNKSSGKKSKTGTGIPLRSSGEQPEPVRGWNDKARAAALATRRRNRDLREAMKRQQSE